MTNKTDRVIQMSIEIIKKREELRLLEIELDKLIYSNEAEFLKKHKPIFIKNRNSTNSRVRVYEVMEKLPYMGFRSRDLHENYLPDIKHSTVREALRKLHLRGYIQKTSRGLFTYVPSKEKEN